jgi:hypothetical protein
MGVICRGVIKLFLFGLVLHKATTYSLRTILAEPLSAKDMPYQYGASYRRGLKDCQIFHNSSSLKPISFESSFQDYNISLFVFNPKQKCSIGSTCWFGVLSCGSINFTKIHIDYNTQVFIPPPTTGFYKNNMESHSISSVSIVPPFRGWSVRSLHLQVIISGSETTSPFARFVPSDNVLIYEYKLVIPGQYHFTIIPREFYSGVLYHYTSTQKIHGLDTLASKFIPAINTTYSSPRYDTNKHEPLRRKHTLPALLPYCSNGNHAGRYITIPNEKEALQICGADIIITQYETWLKEESQNPISFQKRAKAYAEELSLAYLQSDRSKHSIHLHAYMTAQYHNKSLSNHEWLHYKEILRY